MSLLRGSLALSGEFGFLQARHQPQLQKMHILSSVQMLPDAKCSWELVE